MTRTARERRAAVRAEILEAYTVLFAERGYAEATLAETAERVGVPLAEVRAHFADEEACALAAENAALAEVVLAVSRTYQPDRPEIDSVIAGIAAILELMAAQPGLAYIGFIGARQMAPESVRSIHQTGREMVGAMLERGWDYSGSGPRPAGVARAMLGGAEALVRREVAAGRAERLPALLPDCVYIATVPFVGQDAALRLAAQARRGH
jgi:AcrR family transcriptional regulator